MENATPEPTTFPTLTPQKLSEILAYSRALQVLKPAAWPDEPVYFVQN